MPSRFLLIRGRLLPLLLAAFALVALASCSNLPADQPSPSRATASAPAAASVQDQLAQLAAESTLQPSATRSGAALSSATRPAVRASATPRPRATRTPTPSDSLPTIARAQLPAQARDTIRLIEQGGPFPYDKDGATFGNREGLLPKRPSGYYREYTVITPGSRDRGARRIVAGQGGELYYTDDHYDSFKRVIP